MLRDLYYRAYPKINMRITVPFMAVVVIVAGVGIFIVTRLVAGNIEERLNNHLLDSSQTAQNAIVEIEESALATLRLMTFTDGVAELIEANNSIELNTLLVGLAANARVDELIVFNASGSNIYRFAVGGGNLLNLETWSSVQRTITGDFDTLGDKLSEVQQIDDRTVIIFTAPVYNSAGDVVGGVSIGFNSGTLLRLVTEQSLSTLIIMDMQGRIMDSSIRTLLDDPATPFIDNAAEIIADSSNKTWLEERNINDLQYKFIYSRFQIRGETAGVLGIGLPIDFVTERISTSRDTFALLFVGVFAVVSVLGLSVTRSIIQPVSRLVDTTRAIRDGDLSRRVELNMPDELGELGRSFDHMTDQLVARNHEISGLYHEQLVETTRREAILTSIHDVVVVLNGHGEIILQNRAATSLQYQLEQDEAAQRRYLDIIQKPRRLFEPQQVSLLSYHFNVIASPVEMENGDVLGYVIVFNNITDLILAQQLKDTMILQLSHELRTPFTAIKGYVEILQVFGDLNEQNQEYVSKALGQITVMNDMLNQVIEVSALLAGKLSLFYTEFSVNQVLEDVIAKYAQRIEQAQIQLTLKSPQQPILIEGDEERFKMAFEQILQNAYQYNLPGGWVEISSEVHGKNIKVYVVDSGVGIAADEQGKVFERMYRGRAADAGPTDTRGLGLGLFISKEIIQAHHGKITLESQVDNGTIVTITVPIRR